MKGLPMTDKQTAKYLAVLEKKAKLDKSQLNEMDILKESFLGREDYPLWPGWVEILDELYEFVTAPVEMEAVA